MKNLEKHNVVKFIESKNIKSFTKIELVKEIMRYYKQDGWFSYYYIQPILEQLLKDKYLKATYYSEQRVHGYVTVALYERI